MPEEARAREDDSVDPEDGIRNRTDLKDSGDLNNGIRRCGGICGDVCRT